MIYDFSHYATDAGRRVQFIVSRDDVAALRRAGLFAGEALRGILVYSAVSADDVILVMTPTIARAFIDALLLHGR